MASFLDGLDSRQVAALYASGTVRCYPHGVALFHERQAFDRVIILLSGRVKITAITAEGEEVVLAIRDPGDMIGEMSAVDGPERSASAVTLEPVQVLAVSGSAFSAFLQRSPQAALVLLQVVTARLREADRKSVEFVTQDTTGRVAARLVELAERYGEPCAHGISIDLRLSQEELAGWAGCSRDAVTKALQTMRSLQWITTGRRTIAVRDLDALRCRSGGMCAQRAAA